MDSKSSNARKMEQFSLQLPASSVPEFDPSTPHDLQFDRQQPPDQDFDRDKTFEFGKFVAREAMLDEEFWVGNHFYWRQYLNHEILWV